VVDLSFGAKPAFSVEPLAQGSSSSASVGSNGSPIPPAQVVIDLAPGYAVTATPPGTTVGLAFVYSTSGSGLSGTIALINGEVIADDPARYAGDPGAQACAPGPYTAVWRLSAIVFGLSYTLPIFVGHPSGDPQGVELRLCPPPLVGSDGKPVTPTPVPLTRAAFLVSSLTAPTTAGEYVSRAFVTPESAAGAPDPGSMLEARFLDPIPHVLTLKDRYDAKSHDAVLTGRVMELGKPQADAIVDLTRINSFTLAKRVRTSANGTFSARIKIASTTRFAAGVPDSTGACPGPSTAPRGCASLTVAGTTLKLVRVVVPPHKG
jgi:hypothetical protein